MSDQPQVPVFQLVDLLSALKPYQSHSISQLCDKHGEVEAAKIWLSARGPSDTQRFGGSAPNDSEPFWDKFNEELRLFICGDKKYKKEREQLLADAKPTAFVLISGISGYLGATLGFAPSLLAPAVAMMLYSIGKVGINAWCKCG